MLVDSTIFYFNFNFLDKFKNNPLSRDFCSKAKAWLQSAAGATQRLQVSALGWAWQRSTVVNNAVKSSVSGR